MKIAIINITGGGISGGYRKYLQNIIPRMAAHPNVGAILCASPESLNVQSCFGPLSNIEFITCRPFRFFQRSLDSELKRNLEVFSPDVIFVPVERSFRFKEVPVVNMIQNMEPFTPNSEGNSFSERFKLLMQYVDGKRAIKRANRVIALSKFVSDFLVTCWRIPNEKIGIVHHGIDAVNNEGGKRPHIIPEDWNGQFFFTAGSIRPARGLEDLLRAMKHLSLQGKKTVRLVIAGESGHRMVGYQKKLQDWAQENNLLDRICWAGSLNENEMAWCYQNCSAFVMTSRVESFGMIGGEAMSHGCVCISANNPCLTELFGDAAIFYPQKDGKALAEAIQTVLTWDDNQQKVMCEKARRQAAKFSWDICAEKTVAVLAKVVESRQSGKL